MSPSGQPSSPRERELFVQAMEQPSREERDVFLDGACGKDTPVRRRLAKLLAQFDRLGTFLDQPVVSGEDRSGLLAAAPSGVAGGETVLLPVTEKPGDRIGRYKLREKIGEGGCGLVYVAEQEEPVRRRVALKVIKLGMDTKQVVARFEAERQALAMMDHPNIAKVLDAGATETGRPYFVMELVRGIRITDYCDQNKLSTPERLDLFLKVCHAIQHAHQKGIIHRDIKPSNVLVTSHDGVPVPKVIDFGIAKAMEQKLTEKTLYTAFEQFIGTPAYTSPEQAGMSGLDIDTRSDIYALGVLLYELLTGMTPFDGQELVAAGLEEMRRTIREKEPVRPSTRLRTMLNGDLTTTAARRRTEAPRLIHLLRGDLDWIVMKCLEKDRTRRYDTANGLATDIERHLKHEPVTARPPSTAYRAKKFVRRNKLMVTAGAMVATALAIGVVGVLWQWQRARQERASAGAHGYASDMYAAQQALMADDLGQVRRLLDRFRPGTGREHLRGFEWRYLVGEIRSDAQAMDTSSTESVPSLALSPDGRTLAVGRYLGSRVELLDSATFQRVATLESKAPWAVAAFSPKGDLLAATGTNGVVHLWRLGPPRVVGELAHANLVLCLAFSPDAKHLAVSTSLNGVWIWDLESLQPVWRCPESGRWLHRGDVCFSPDGRYLAVGDDRGQVHVLDWAASREVVVIPVHNRAITSLAYSPDGRLLASGTVWDQNEIRLWNPMTGEAVGSLVGHRASIFALQFTADGRRLVSGSADQTIRIWDVSTRQAVRTLRGHRYEVWSLVLSPDNETIYSGGKDGSLARWSLSTNPPPSQCVELAGSGEAGAFLHDGKSVAAIRRDGAVAIYELPSGRPGAVLDALGTNNRTLAVAPRSGLLACGTPDGSVRIWSLSAHRMVTNLPPFPGPGSAAYPRIVFSLAEDLFAVQRQARAEVWDTRTWARCSTFDIPPGTTAAEFSPDGRTLALGHSEGHVTLWDWATGAKLTEARGHGDIVNGLTFSPDGSKMASASDDGTVALWDRRTSRLLAKWTGHFLALKGVTFSPDGTRMATGLAAGQAARLWDVNTRREVLTLAAPGRHFFTVRFAPDGGRLLCGTSMGPCYVWSPRSLAELDAEYTRQHAAR